MNLVYSHSDIVFTLTISMSVCLLIMAILSLVAAIIKIDRDTKVLGMKMISDLENINKALTTKLTNKRI